MNASVEDGGVSTVEARRAAAVVRTSIVGIVANVALAAFKAAVGLGANSIAIVLDAVNNLSDAVSSLITIVGTKLASRHATRDHPYGYGRVEYVTTTIIASVVVGAGVSSLYESVRRIAHPEVASYGVVSLVIVGVGVIVKVALGLYTRARGSSLDSGALIASGTDALTDSALSAATLAAALVDVCVGVNVDAWLGAAIALVIVKAGADILREAVGRILGERVDADTATAIHACVDAVDGVRGSHDLILNDYGPNRLWGSLHVEVDDAMTAREIDALAREITARVYEQTGVIVHTVGVYSSNTGDALASRMRGEVVRIALSHEYVRQVHGFYLDERAKAISFDIVISFDAPSRTVVCRDVVADVQRRYPDHTVTVALDSDVSD